jgi:hypothetical protein
MKRLLLLPVAALSLLIPALSQKSSDPFVGRWDMTVSAQNGSYPGWMEVVDTDGHPQVRVQPRSGSVRPVKDARFEGSRLVLALSPASGNRPTMSWELTASGDSISGQLKHGDEVAGQVTGVRAPALKREAPSAWSKPEPLFNGKDLSGWEPDRPDNNHWVAKDGVLLNESKGANLRTTRKFDDFKLHIEYNCPDHGNSGVYLRGRYEIQVEYEPVGTEDKFHTLGAIYGFLAPSIDLPRKPGEWEGLDVTLVGRNLSIVRNGVKTIDNQEIPGITGGAIDSNEGEPGPFYIQGDHTGGMQYRNITIAVPKR